MGKALNRKERRALKFGKAHQNEKGELIYGTEKKPKEVHFEPRNDKQRDLYISLLGDPCVVVTGAAGTGKTYVSASVAAKEYSEGRIAKIIISRPNVGTGKSLGAFPGTVEEKMAPWLVAITDVLRKQLGEGKFKYAMQHRHIEIQPMETIRGRSFPNSFILFDEAQNLTRDDLKAIVTRQGENSTMVLMGDKTQRDVTVDGLSWLRKIARKYDVSASFHEFTSDDIIRSGICKQWVKAFEGESDDNNSI